MSNPALQNSMYVCLVICIYIFILYMHVHEQTHIVRSPVMIEEKNPLTIGRYPGPPSVYNHTQSARADMLQEVSPLALPPT